MPIAVDLDEVTYPLLKHHSKFLNKKYGFDLSEEDFKSYNFWETYGVTKKQAIQDFYEFSATPEFAAIEPYPGAVQGIRDLRKLDELIVVTSRPQDLELITLNNLDRDFPNIFSKIFLGNYMSIGYEPVKTKRDLCEMNNAWLLIDDSADYAKDVSKDIPIILMNRPWNQGIEGRNIIRAFSWKDINKIAKELNTNPFCLEE